MALCEDIIERVIREAEYIAETGATVRKTAKVFHFSKSTVHKDVTERLNSIDKDLYKKVKKHIAKNNYCGKIETENLFVQRRRKCLHI